MTRISVDTLNDLHNFSILLNKKYRIFSQAILDNDNFGCSNIDFIIYLQNIKTSKFQELYVSSYEGYELSEEDHNHLVNYITEKKKEIIRYIVPFIEDLEKIE